MKLWNGVENGESTSMQIKQNIASQGSFEQSLVEIGKVVPEERIFLKFRPPFF